MNALLRLVDANLNRASEGLRVVEDIARFYLHDSLLAGETRALRHQLRAALGPIGDQALAARAVEGDVGFALSQGEPAVSHGSLLGFAHANFKRVQEGLRVLEESLRLLGHPALSKCCETLRFRVYSLESQFVPQLRPAGAAQLLEGDLYGITAEKYALGRSNVRTVEEMLAAGIRVVQYREKKKDAREKYEECRRIRRMTREAGATFIVNDHPDLAMMVEADGVHLGQRDYPVEVVRALVGPRMLIGISTHSLEQARDAVARGADYIGVGPIFPTATKDSPPPPLGLDHVESVARHIAIPFVVVGGIKVEHVAELRRRGAKLIAMASEIVGARDIAARVREIRAAMNEGEVPVP